MPIKRSDLVASAMKFENVPYAEQGRDMKGLDCIGILILLANEYKITDLDFLGYGKDPEHFHLQENLDKYLIRLPEGEPLLVCDVILMRFLKEPQHVAIVTRTYNGGCFVLHALRDYGISEHMFDYRWIRQNRAKIVATYRLPGIED